jgi:Secretion system C-terminal sorting domain
MKQTYFFLLLFSCFYAAAQDKIVFSYDAAGNQIERRLCISCTDPNAKYISDPKQLTKEDLITSDVSDLVSYYPNPVQQELYLSWQLANNNAVTTIQTFDLNGRLIQSYQGLESANVQTVSFANYPTGVYAVVLAYSNGETKSIKIVKAP